MQLEHLHDYQTNTDFANVDGKLHLISHLEGGGIAVIPASAELLHAIALNALYIQAYEMAVAAQDAEAAKPKVRASILVREVDPAEYDPLVKVLRNQQRILGP